jgi:hypothetical protein
MAFAAQYPGTCDACESDIKPGQMIQNSTEAHRAWQSYEHVVCPEPTPDLTPEKPCPKCFLIHAGECPW